ncbi:MAG: hypothetical protein ACR2PT_13575 [Endozoicomonas sp.]
MLSGVSSNGARLPVIEEKPPIAEPAAVSHPVSPQVAGHAGLHLKPSCLSRVSIVDDNDFESPIVYQEQAEAVFREKFGDLPSPRPELSKETRHLIEQLPQLQTTERGRKVLQLVIAIGELLDSSSEKHPGKLLLSTAREALNEEQEDLALAKVTRLANQMISECSSSRLYNFDFQKLIKNRTSDDILDDIWDYLAFAIQLSRRCRQTGKTLLYTGAMLFADMQLARKASGDSSHLVNLPWPQFSLWLDSIDAREHIGISSGGPLRIGSFHLAELSTFFWARAMADFVEGRSHSLGKKQVKSYFLSTLLPLTIQQQLFAPPGSATFSGMLTDQAQLLPLVSQQFDESAVLFGEEFELSPVHGPLTSNEHCRQFLTLWAEKLETELKRSEVCDYQITFCFSEPPYSIDVRVGNWECSVFRDDEVLEVTTTPYSMAQTFTIEGKSFSAYECFDQFIFSVASKLGMTGDSGHKHLDLRTSFQGNRILLFLNQLDMENNAWLARALGRENQVRFFPYIAQPEHETIQQEKLKVMVEAVNRQLAAGPSLRDTKGFKSLCEFKNYLNDLYLWYDHSPCALGHIIHEYHDPSIHQTPTSTLEYRLFHCPRSGSEAWLFNELLVHRLKYLQKCINEHRPVAYHPIDPRYYGQDLNEEVIKLFVAYIREMGEEPTKYRPLLRITVPESCEELFKTHSSD